MGFGVDGNTAQQAAISRTLDRLKRDGSTILVAGATVDSHQTACARLLGRSQPAAAQIVVCPDQPHCSTGGTEGYRERGPVHLVPDGYTTSEGDPLTRLGTAIVDEIEKRPAHDDVRVCIDAADELVETHGTEPVFRLLHVLTSALKRSRAIGHVHVPRTRSHEWVTVLEPVCDALLEVRSAEGVDEQRLHLRGPRTTEWLPL